MKLKRTLSIGGERRYYADEVDAMLREIKVRLLIVAMCKTDKQRVDELYALNNFIEVHDQKSPAHNGASSTQ